jgi:hypothetical protein
MTVALVLLTLCLVIGFAVVVLENKRRKMRRKMTKVSPHLKYAPGY